MQRKPVAFPYPIYITRPMLPPLAEYIEELKDVWDSQWLTNAGGKHAALEKAIARLVGNNKVSLFTNGTLALIVACQALRLSGEVITTPFTFAATPHVLSWNNITPVFADIDPVTMTLDPERIEALITSRTSAILGVHVYGYPCDVEAIQVIANRHGLKVVYDGAHAFGTRVNGRPITDFGDATMLSFHATKLFHTAEGGALVMQNPSMKEQVDFLKNFGIKDETTVLLPGINGKMNELQAALGLLTIKMVKDEQYRRQAIGRIYEERLRRIAGLFLPKLPQNVENSYQYYPIRITSAVARRSRDEVFEALRSYNIYARRYFHPLCSEYACYRMLPSAHPSYLPVATKTATEVLCLPFYGGLSDDQVQQICDVIEFVMQE